MEKLVPFLKDVGFPIVVALILLYAVLQSLPALDSKVEALRAEVHAQGERLQRVELLLNGEHEK